MLVAYFVTLHLSEVSMIDNNNADILIVLNITKIYINRTLLRKIPYDARYCVIIEQTYAKLFNLFIISNI